MGLPPGSSSDADPAPSTGSDGFTTLLHRLREGDERARNALYERSFVRLRRYAQRLMGEQNGHTLQPTALVNEAWLRLANGRDAAEDWVDQSHFIGTLARAMRSAIVDHERQRRTLRRQPPGQRVDLEDVHAAYAERAEDLVALDEALTLLGQEEPELVQVVELRFFLGCTTQEAADLLEVSRKTVERRFDCARQWLYRRVRGG